MTTPTELQSLLRFLSQDAKLPLQEAMASIKSLKAANLTSLESISQSSTEDLGKVFVNQKTAKLVLAKAKSATKKRSLPSDTGNLTQSSGKRNRTDHNEGFISNPDSLSSEQGLLLPTSSATESELSSLVFHTNRAPLVLAFAIVLLSYTHPHQPLSSRLSLAQAVVSANSRSKAVSLGLETETAESLGWSEGQPKIKLMGREISVLRRWGYEVFDISEVSSTSSTLQDDSASNVDQSKPAAGWTESTVPLWGLDIEALRNANKTKASPNAPPTSSLPVFTPQNARNYLIRSFLSAPNSESPKKLSAKELSAQKERNAALLLQAIDLLFKSWKDILSRDDLDKRAWNWYVAVRPDVENGVRGWGEKGAVELKKILALRRNTNENSAT